LHSFTIVRQQPAVYQGAIPYSFGQVKLQEGVNVEGLLTCPDFDELKLDIPMEMVVDKLQEDEEGNDVVCYKFRPSKA
jgi:uncharacterized OB-fold protein